MHVGAALAFNQHTSPQFIGAAARMIEEAGFHSLWVPEHVLFFPNYASRYPYSESGKLPGNPDGVLEPFTALTWVAAHTKSLRLGTGICLVPQRAPVYTAKQVADLDYLSGGRVDFGVGIGWLEEEFDNLGLSFRTRAARCAEYIDAMKALWSPGVSTFIGPTVQLTECHFNPKPVQQPHPPIYFGGESDAALRRVARQGDGWYGFNLSPEALTERLQRLTVLLGEQGRQRSDISVFVCPSTHPVNADTVPRYRDAGIQQLIVPAGGRDLDTLARRVERMRELTGLAA